MNKYKDLTKKTVKTAIACAIAIGIAVGIYIAISVMVDSVAKDKKDVESKLSADNSLLSTLRDQMNKSGAAEKRYAALQETRSTVAYDTNMKTLSEFLGDAVERYKLNTLKINKITPVVSDKPELANFNYDVQVWNRFRITFKSVSDVHVFSFIDYLRRAAPGFIRIDSVDLRRVSDMTDSSLTQIRTAGTMPLNVEAKIEFTWIGLKLKEKLKTPSQASTPTPRE